MTGSENDSGSFGIRLVDAWVNAFIDTCCEHEHRLGELDRLAGDGDFGTNIRTALEHARSRLAATEADTVDTPFAALSSGFLNVGGTSGPLFGMWFQNLTAATTGLTELDVQSLSSGVATGTAAVRRLGGADPGDRTMVDALAPATEALQRAAEQGLSLGDALEHAARHARRGAEATVGMTARRGRASYLGDRAAGAVDPGAETVAMFFEVGAGVAHGQPRVPRRRGSLGTSGS